MTRHLSLSISNVLIHRYERYACFGELTFYAPQKWFFCSSYCPECLSCCQWRRGKMNGREKQEMTSLSQKHFEIQGHALSFYFFSSISSPSTFHIVGLNDYWWKLKAIREIGIIICDDPSKATVGSISLLSACSSHFISFVTWIPFRQALPSALPLASATACYSTCQKLLSLNLTLPSPFLLHITLDSYVFFFLLQYHTFSQAECNLNNNFKYTVDLQTHICSSASVLKSRTAGSTAVSATSSPRGPTTCHLPPCSASAVITSATSA